MLAYNTDKITTTRNVIILLFSKILYSNKYIQNAKLITSRPMQDLQTQFTHIQNKKIQFVHNKNNYLQR